MLTLQHSEQRILYRSLHRSVRFCSQEDCERGKNPSREIQAWVEASGFNARKFLTNTLRFDTVLSPTGHLPSCEGTLPHLPQHLWGRSDLKSHLKLKTQPPPLSYRYCQWINPILLNWRTKRLLLKAYMVPAFSLRQTVNCSAGGQAGTASHRSTSSKLVWARSYCFHPRIISTPGYIKNLNFPKGGCYARLEWEPCGVLSCLNKTAWKS